jgi:hypothetical protein
VHREDVLPLKAAWQHVRASMRERVANSKKRRGSFAALAPEIEPEIEYLSGLKFRELSVANSTCRGRQAIKALFRLYYGVIKAPLMRTRFIAAGKLLRLC